MKPLISPDAMRDRERLYFERGGAKSIDVMERAAQALADAIAARVPLGGRVWFACGSGGNGGDGLACARLLRSKYECAVVLPKAPKSEDAAENLRRLSDVPILETAEALPRPDAWVDALFGTGLSRAPTGAYADLIARVNADGATVFAADIPSGLNGATGVAYAPCVRADVTVTFQYEKTGMALADGLDSCGEVMVADVGFPDFAPYDAMLLSAADLPALLPRRPRNIHKGSCGHLLIVAGSFGMAGAAALCASAALRSGAGLVTVACPTAIVPILQTLVPCAMCVPVESADDVRAALRGKSAAVVGCGLSQKVSSEMVRAVLESGLPAVVDADALNLLHTSDGTRTPADALRSCHILTPHPGEARRLLKGADDALLKDPIAACHALHDALPNHPTVLYKGASTVITDGEQTFVSASGCCGMARGGSGDILSGILGALLAERSERSFAETAALASELHGLAGERAQRKYGSRAMNARDILEFLPEVFPN